MIKATFKTQEGVYWAVCEKMRYVKGSGYFMENVVEDSSSPGSSLWSKTPEGWKLMQIEVA